MDAPQTRLVVRLGAARTDDRAVGQSDRLVLDRTQNPFGKTPGLAPRLPGVARRPHDAPPVPRIGTDLVEEGERAVRHLEEDRVPARVPGPVRLNASRDLDGRRPRAFHLARNPDADVWRAFACASEPRGDETLARLGDGRRVHARERRRLEEEFGLHDRRAAALPRAGPFDRLRAGGVVEELTGDRQQGGGSDRGVYLMSSSTAAADG